MCLTPALVRAQDFDAPVPDCPSGDPAGLGTTNETFPLERFMTHLRELCGLARPGVTRNDYDLMAPDCLRDGVTFLMDW